MTHLNEEKPKVTHPQTHFSAEKAVHASAKGAAPRLDVRHIYRRMGILRAVILLVGLGLLISAIYGQITGIRVAERVAVSDLRFENDLSLSAEETMEQLKRLPNESDAAFVQRSTLTIQAGLAHLDRWYDHNPEHYNQLIPFSENPLLNLLGRYSGLPQIERYHFSDYKRTIDRGIGLCGDHAIVLSSVLDENGIDNVLLSARGGGHIVVEVTDKSDAQGIYDADFGVSMPSLTQSSMTDPSVVQAYSEAGYSSRELLAIQKIYSENFLQFDSVYHFMAKRFIFERLSYVFKWLFPLFLIAVAIWFSWEKSDSKTPYSPSH